MELYVIGTLAGLGYLLTKENKNNKDASNIKILKNEIPSVNNVYDSKFSNSVDKTLRKKAHKLHNKSQNYKQTGIIPINLKKIPDKVTSSLAGIEIPVDEFKHNNMVPFFGGKIKQNIDVDRTHSTLERYTGVSDLYKNKTEIAPMTDLTSGTGNVYGMEAITDFEQDRMVGSKLKNNILPFKQIKVGPGLGQGFGSTPTGGFQQDTRQYEYEPNVDQLRIGSNPKIVDEGRTVSGQKYSLPGVSGEVVKNRVDTYYEQDPSKYLTTTGAQIKEANRPCEVMKDTSRKDTSKDYTGVAYNNHKEEYRSDVKCSDKQQLDGYGLRNEDKTAVGREDDDFGKANILVYTNERDITTTKSYEGNLTSLVKSIVAPLQDALKFSGKEYTVLSERPYGNLQAQFPDKQTIYDPNDVARTTLKEQNIHDTQTGNMTAEWSKVAVYDPDDIAKTTIRETLQNDDTGINLRLKVPKQTIYDPNDISKTTIKELTEDGTRAGYINRSAIQDGGAYETNPQEIKNTNKQFLSQNSYQGIIDDTRGGGDGYKIENFDAKNTNKQFTSDNDYYSTAMSANKKTMSYQDKYNMLVNDVKEMVLEDRVPTAQGTKQTVNGSMMNVQPTKMQKSIDNDHLYGNLDKVYEATDSLVNPTYTKGKKHYEEQSTDRMDPNLLSAFHENPYSKPLNSVF